MIRYIAVIIVSLFLVAGTVLAQGYVNPPPQPPLNNVSALINVGSATQNKAGNFMANIVAAATSTWSPRYCDALGNNCFTPASRVSSGGISLLTGGTGISLSPATITSTGTISINQNVVQRRVLGCPAGQVIRQINVDGTVVCEPTTTSCFYNGTSFPAGHRCRVAVSSCSTGTMYYYKTCSNGSWSFGSQCTLSTITFPAC